MEKSKQLFRRETGELLKASQLNGIIVPLETPFLYQNGRQVVDILSQHNQIRRMALGGANGIFLGSNAGEGRQMDKDNLKLSISAGIESTHQVMPDMPVVVGILRKSLAETVELAQYAEANGADAIVLAPGYTENNELEETVNSVMATTKLPIILYNNREFNRELALGSKDIPLSFIRKILSENPNASRIIGIKDTSRDVDYFSELESIRDEYGRDKLHVFQGDTKAGLEDIISDVDGWVPVEANINITAFAKLWEEKNNEMLFGLLSFFEQNKQEFGGTLRFVKHILNKYKIFATASMYGDEEITSK